MPRESLDGYFAHGKLQPLSVKWFKQMTHARSDHELDGPPDRRSELLAFLILTIVLAPALAVAIVGGWGLLVWTYQMIYGPPGPPPA